MSFSNRGGARVGAGRKRQREHGPSHEKRPTWAEARPVHVTVKVRPHVWNLRTQRCFEAICAAFVAGCNRFGMRVIGLGVQGNHLHLLVEAACAAALAAGMKGLEVRLARGINRVMGRKGSVFLERFNAHVLRTPREVRAAMHYISRNTAKHAAQVGRPLPAGYRDPYTVGHFGTRSLRPAGTEGMVVEPETWLLCHGWKRGVGPAAAEGARRPGKPRTVTASQALPLFGKMSDARLDCVLPEHRDRPGGTIAPRAA